MNQHRETQKPQVVTVAVMVLLVLIGGWSGIFMSERFAPGSVLAAPVSLLMLPLAFLLGMQLWRGFAIFMVLGRSRSERLVGGGGHEQHGPGGMPAEATAFVPVSLLFAGVAGLLVGTLGAAGLLWTVFCYLGLGLLYGTLCWRCASWGLL